MEQKGHYLLVESSVLPEVFHKVIAAKRLLAQGQAKSSAEAVKMVDLSRSAYYKYRDRVFTYDQNLADKLVTYSFVLLDEPGVLLSVINTLYNAGANILTINQNIPVDGVAPVTIAFRTAEMRLSEEEILEKIRQVRGVVDVKSITSR